MNINDKTIVQLKGNLLDDCSDIVDTVVFSYIDKSRVSHHIQSENYPFQCCIDEIDCRGGYICATIYFNDLNLSSQILSYNISTEANQFNFFSISPTKKYYEHGNPSSNRASPELASQVASICKENLDIILTRLGESIDFSKLETPTWDGKSMSHFLFLSTLTIY